jgi:23S rRNA pseudouridine1911/1915/1917 synthase
MLRFTVTDEQAGARLDNYIVSQMPMLSRAFVRKLSDMGQIRVNDKQQKTSGKVKTGDKITIDYSPEQLENIPEIDLPILYEDDDCIVINKPVGLLTHSKGAFNPEATVASFLHNKVEDLDGDRAGIVHRLDRATSGVLIAAKTEAALAHLQKQFSQRKVKKTYIAVIEGTLQPRTAVIDMPIERNPKKPQTFRVGANGKPSQTAYETLEENEKYSLLQLKPETGRTHQLRVHLEHQGHPIVGDTFYGGKAADRLYLHALSLEITLPNKVRKLFTAPLPTSFHTIIKS